MGQIESQACENFERTESLEEGTVTICTPNKATNWYRVVKVIREDESKIYLSIRGGGYSASANETDVLVLLEDGSRLEWPNDILEKDDLPNEKRMQFTAFIPLSDDDINKLASSTISDSRVNIYEGKATKKNALELMQQMGCIRDVN